MYQTWRKGQHMGTTQVLDGVWCTASMPERILDKTLLLL